jgi:hypothetical protein
MHKKIESIEIVTEGNRLFAYLHLEESVTLRIADLERYQKFAHRAIKAAMIERGGKSRDRLSIGSMATMNDLVGISDIRVIKYFQLGYVGGN